MREVEIPESFLHEIEVRQLKKTITTFRGSLKRGQTIFKLDLTTGEISEVKIERSGQWPNEEREKLRKMVFNRTGELIMPPVVVARIEQTGNELFCCALNRKNAKIKFEKIIHSITGGEV